MNLLLLRQEEIGAGSIVKLEDRRLTHLREVLKVQHGQQLRVGILGGLMGTAEVLSPDTLKVTVSEAPPPRANVSLILAVPRPKQLKRVIPAVASLGVNRVVLINAARVEKSYFDSKVLNREFLDSLVELGLEQACDTIAPVIEIRERLKPFIEDELSKWAPEGPRLVPHPYASAPLAPVPFAQHVTLAIGPDGGWVPFEVELFSKHGFTPVSLGRRVLRGEVAVPSILGALRSGQPHG